MGRSRIHGRERIVAAVALGALFLGLWLAISLGLREDEEVAAPTSPPTATEPAAPPPRAPTPRPAPFVRLSAAGAFDPDGDGRERDEEAGLAVDGRRDTAWRTERYSSTFSKEGVGLVLDAGRRVRVERVVVDVPAAGGRAAIQLGDEREGPFATVSPARNLSGRTTFRVARRPGRYIVIWVVAVPTGGAVEIAEVRARARG
jgi:hypothetical protein